MKTPETWSFLRTDQQKIPMTVSIPQRWIAQHTLQGFAFNARPFCYASLVNLWQGCSPSSGLIIPGPLLRYFIWQKIAKSTPPSPAMTPASYEQRVPSQPTLAWYRLCREPSPRYIRLAIWAECAFDSAHMQRCFGQIKVLNRVLDGGENGFLQGISASQYQKVAKVSKATATRHLADLLEMRIPAKLNSHSGQREHPDP